MSVLQELRGLLKLRLLQLLALPVYLGTMAALAFKHKTTVHDPDLWWHLKVGEWITEHHAVPYTGLFSRTAGTHPWLAYSWGFEVLLARSYAWMGLIGFALFGIMITLLVAYTLFWMAHRLSGRFWFSWALVFFASFGFLFTLMPRPVFFSMIFYAVTLTLLFEAQREGKVQTLYWLPLVFALWANTHIQFIYGLFVLGLFAGTNLLQRVAARLGTNLPFLTSPTLPAGRLVGVAGASFCATLIGPYGYHIYDVVKAYSKSHVAYFMIQELESLSFSSFTHYILLLTTCAAFFVLGSRGKLDLFKISLLSVASIVAFRTQRDSWFLVIAAVLMIADCMPKGQKINPVFSLPEGLGVLGVLAFVLFLAAGNNDFNTRDLDRAVSHVFPVNAANFLRQSQLSGPIYNTLDWGGFLIWYLPQYPVSIDGRNDLYGDEMDLRMFKTENGDDYASDVQLNEAGVVLLPKVGTLAKLLSVDTRFRLVYQDQLAVIYTRN